MVPSLHCHHSVLARMREVSPEVILSRLQYSMTPLMYPVNHSTVLHCMTLRGAGNGLYTALFLRCIEGHHLCDVEIS